MAGKKKKRPKRISMRPLSAGDLRVLEFLWTWKAASLQMLGLAGYPKKSNWRVYRAIRQLEKEKYIERLPRTKFLQQEVFALTELGFETVLVDRDDLKERRFRVHAPAHDYLATCLQLGDFWLSRVEKTFYTEQMLSSLGEQNFPECMQRSSSHVPDGMTVLGFGEENLVIGYEVDLNLKPNNRYIDTAYYHWQAVRTHILVWLVRDQRLQEQICAALEKDKRELLQITAFVLLDDFRRDVWGAKIAKGYMQGESLRKLHANELQKVSKGPANIQQFNMRGIFFGKHLSPQRQSEMKREMTHEKV